MKDGKNKLGSVMKGGEWWTLRDLVKATRMSKGETRARVEALIEKGLVDVEGKTKGRKYRLRRKAAALAAQSQPSPHPVHVNARCTITPAPNQVGEGEYCIQCGIEILKRDRCDDCAQHPIPIDKAIMRCPSCKHPARVEFKRGIVAVELAAKCEHCGLMMSTIEIPHKH